VPSDRSHARRVDVALEPLLDSSVPLGREAPAPPPPRRVRDLHRRAAQARGDPLTSRPALEGTVEPREDERAAAGEYLPGGGAGTLGDAHAPEREAVVLLGKDPQLEELDPEWIITRLMREATDYGTRSRQTARVASLTTLAKITGLLGEEDGLAKHKDTRTPLQRAIDMPAEERRQMIVDRVRKLQAAGLIKRSDLPED